MNTLWCLLRWATLPPDTKSLVSDVLDMSDKLVFVCLDDILIFFQSSGKHEQHVRLVPRRLLENKTRCESCKIWVSHLRNPHSSVTSPQRWARQMNSAKITIVSERPRHADHTLWQCYWHFIKNYRHAALTSTPAVHSTSRVMQTPPSVTSIDFLQLLLQWQHMGC